MKSKRRSWATFCRPDLAVVGLAWLLGGAGLNRWVETVRASEADSLSSEKVSGDRPAGEGARDPWVGLGGLRTLAANVAWLRAAAAWEQSDSQATVAAIEQATAMDPRCQYFWINGARMLAYDVPQWEIAALDRQGPLPGAVRRRVCLGWADRGLALLESARRHHPASVGVLMEMAALQLGAKADPVAAVASLRAAAELKNAPPCAVRLHAQILRRLGRSAEAYAWLCDGYAKLTASWSLEDQAILQLRIREIAEELKFVDEEHVIN